MVFVIMLWIRVKQILAFEVNDFCYISAESVLFDFYSSISGELLLRPLWNILISERAWWGLSDGHTLVDLDFLLRSAQFAKNALFWAIDHNSGREKENYTNDPFFRLLFEL